MTDLLGPAIAYKLGQSIGSKRVAPYKKPGKQPTGALMDTGVAYMSSDRESLHQI
ncbi:hypothetical protein [Candidatus Williamhamiltonella defendens]|uniref:hypothetical protein n=1 Tax=Candidatus Williamhamiltonella defendens TaxID=138072 RepID=UPI001651428C|nr:hypothetical protein [Candidatus Hamiltonella defensa]